MNIAELPATESLVDAAPYGMVGVPSVLATCGMSLLCQSDGSIVGQSDAKEPGAIAVTGRHISELMTFPLAGIAPDWDTLIETALPLVGIPVQLGGLLPECAAEGCFFGIPDVRSNAATVLVFLRVPTHGGSSAAAESATGSLMDGANIPGAALLPERRRSSSHVTIDGALFTDLRHDLRNKLSVIASGVKVLHRATDETRAGWARETITRQVDEALRVLEEFSDIIAVLQGDLKLRRTKASAGRMLRTATAFAARRLGTRDLRVRLSVPATEILLFVDERRIVDAVSFTIAAYATNDPTVEVSLIADPQKSLAKITVRRTGASPAVSGSAIPDLLGSRGLLVARLLELQGGSMRPAADGSLVISLPLYVSL